MKLTSYKKIKMVNYLINYLNSGKNHVMDIKTVIFMSSRKVWGQIVHPRDVEKYFPELESYLKEYRTTKYSKIEFLHEDRSIMINMLKKLKEDLSS